ncbi:HNH endonuclease [Candidatus Poriferisocius sp.]|uniref:HNH endonuclease n=1 Tax=Candidatus Poriferisocius sp. TaxID=3101276 RepID=UPI003B0281F5
MHIGFRTSGGGRGEYELVGHHGSLGAADLVGWDVKWDLPGIGECETGIWIDSGASGKPRLRSRILHDRPQVGRQIAAILLLPRPVRERNSLGVGFPILGDREYFLAKIGFKGSSTFDEDLKVIVMKPAYIAVENETDNDIMYFDSRWDRVRRIHDSHMVDENYRALLSILQEHQDSLEGRDISRSSVASAEKLTKYFNEKGDAVPIIEDTFGIIVEDSSILTLEDIEDDDIEMRVISTSRMRKLRARPSSSREFSPDVRKAWRHTCAFCGLKLPGQKGSIDSGVDAAHILPWAEYDLDNTRNGISLCKIHHWAFDQAVLILRCEGQQYFIEPSSRMDAFEASTQNKLRTAVGPIPEDRLPINAGDRPSPQYIEKLNTDIDVSKLAS